MITVLWFGFKFIFFKIKTVPSSSLIQSNDTAALPRFTGRASTQPIRKEAKQATSEVLAEARALGYEFYPSAQDFIVRELMPVIKQNKFRSREEVYWAAAAIVAGALSKGKKSRKKLMKVEDIKDGWQLYISAVEGSTCKPRECIPRSVLNRKSELLEQNKFFRTLIRS
ncbi:hypothetical protein [Leptothoe spongobia]|uniref:Uncharacterized protein n=1 Tax=Leptothoe spongobia TAU-MAC 1115 TaxID=1967444 RepID=A0A947GGF1_9CYAN|nr:hypothetical protein [Leptothoe spongobia]MBT9314128.1 hypothetical protein [Leptothoe spongobia TAU-MAC 1115]